MRGNDRQGRLDRKQARRAKRDRAVHRCHAGGKAGSQRAVHTGCSALTGRVLRHVRGVPGLRIKSGGPVAGRQVGIRVSVSARLNGSRPVRSRCQSAIGRAGDGKGKGDKAGQKHAHDELIPAAAPV